MLLPRVLTAIVLLALLLAVLYSQSSAAFLATCLGFFAAAAWESSRLFKLRAPLLVAVAWGCAFIVLAWAMNHASLFFWLFASCILLWGGWFVPMLGRGLPALGSIMSGALNFAYTFAVLGCFLAIAVLMQRSAIYLLSVLVVVWVADIGAYFVGKAIGSRKLALSISPGKSWEGAIGGWVLVMLLAVASLYLVPQENFASHLKGNIGVAGMLVVMSLVVMASVVGDLFESMLKRRAGMKDSSNLLPGHGGVLDRVDALIPVLPIAALVSLLL